MINKLKFFLAFFFILMNCSGLLAAEKFSLCVYEVDFKVAGVSPKLGESLEQVLIKELKTDGRFHVVSKRGLQGLISKFSKSGKVTEEELIETAKFTGLDLIAVLIVSGSVPKDGDLLDELFGEPVDNSIKINLKLIDISHDAKIYERSVDFNAISDINPELKKLVKTLNYPIVRGKIVKIKEDKIAIDLGSANGLTEGQELVIFKPFTSTKLGEVEVNTLQGKIGEGVIAKTVNNAAMIKVNDGIKVEEGNIVETMNKLSSDEAITEEPKAVAENAAAVSMPMKGPDQESQKGVEDQSVIQKPFGLGFDVGWPFYGLSFIYWPNQHGIGLNYYQASSSSSGELMHYALKYYYLIQNNFYFSAGLGQYKDRHAYSYYSSSTAEYIENLYGLFFGIKTGDYYTFEFGYGGRSSNTGVSNGMVSFGMGVHMNI